MLSETPQTDRSCATVKSPAYSAASSSNHKTRVSPFVNKTYLTQSILFHPTDFCQLSSDGGEGSSFTFSFFYDPLKDRCNPFIYKGEGGNGNRFGNEKECIRNCSVNAEKTYPMDGKIVINMMNITVIHLDSLLCFKYANC